MTLDQVSDQVLHVAETPLYRDLVKAVGAHQVLSSATDLVRYASDASPYRMVPAVVVTPRNVDDVVAVLSVARRTGHWVTLRSGGTSLNGQAQGDDILLDLRENFRHIEVLDDGHRLHCAPGVILARANVMLSRYGRVLGPDPASAAAATVGGVLVSNASGMTCGVRLNSYKTVDSIVVVLASGTVVDTGAPDADERLRAAEPQLYEALEQLRDDLRADTESVARIRAKFAIKNTSGYRLDAFLDAERPADILTLLMVGSQGTLGVVTDTVWRTVESGPLRRTGFLRFPDAQTAVSVVPALNKANAQAVELMDAASLLAVRHEAGAPDWLALLDDDATDAVILTERQTSDPAHLDQFAADVAACTKGLLVATEGPLLTSEPQQAARYWKMRKGVLASIGAARPAGTTLITEDVVVPPERLSEAVADLQQLLVRHQFTGAVNGHASAGNLHFYVYLDASAPEQVARYRAFMTDLADLICERYDGSLKGEHGTGRNMTGFVEQEWGSTLYGYFERVKQALDPGGLLGRGVMLNPDFEAPFRNLKTIPRVDPRLDPCIECGFCEPVCPSRHLTTTPRQRIAIQREIARSGDGQLATALAQAYEYEAVQTCAGDSSCALACPVHIDTGVAMKTLRAEGHGRVANRVGKQLAERWGMAVGAARNALRLARWMRPVLGDRGLRAVTRVGRAVAGDELVPRWIAEVPGPADALPITSRDRAQAVFFPACINRIFGPPEGADDRTSVSEAVVRLGQRAGHPVWIPPDAAGLCCGTVWHSKGLEAGNQEMAVRIADALWSWSDEGRLPVVVDAASCTLGVSSEIEPYLDPDRLARHRQLTILDATTFTVQELLPDLPTVDQVDVAVIHPTCSMHTLGIAEDLRTLARTTASEVVEPVTATCCGFAGDRGLLHPELTSTATEEEAAEVSAQIAIRPDATTVFVSGNRTCELGLEHATGQPYESVITALERATRPEGR